MKSSTAYLVRMVIVCMSLLAGIFCFTNQGMAQQSHPPFSVDLNMGRGFLGEPDVNTTFQPEVGLNYIPGVFGVGLKAGILAYQPAYNAGQYVAGFEDYTSVENADGKWRSGYLSVGPRLRFSGQLPFTFQSSLDLSLAYNSPPEIAVNFNDPTGSMGDSQLQLSGYSTGDDYRKWSAAVRPEFQLQFSPGGSSRFAINVTTGIQYRLSKNDFTYTQKDLSKVRSLENPKEMYFQFNNAPDIQQSANPPQTNFFTSVGIKIKFGKPRGLHREGIVHRDIASRNPAPIQNGTGDCDDTDECIEPGSKASEATDYNSSRSNTEGIIADGGSGTPSDTMATATDYNSSRSNTEGIANDIDSGDCDDQDECISPESRAAEATDYNSSRSNTTSSRAQDYNSSRSNRPRTIRADDSDTGPIRWMAPESIIVAGPVINGTNSSGDNQDNTDDSQQNDSGWTTKTFTLSPSSYCMKITTNSQKAMRASALNHNASRSNRSQGIRNTGDNGSGDGDIDSGNQAQSMATSHNASRSNRSSGMINDGSDTGDLDSDADSINAAPATSHNASRSNRSQGIANNGSNTGDSNWDADSADVAPATSHNASRSNRSQGIANNDSNAGDLDSDTDSINAALATSHNASRSNRSSGLMNDGFGGDLDGDGFPDVMKNASFSISKRSARTGRSNEDSDEDGYGDPGAIQITLEVGDPDSDADGLMDAIEASSFSISKPVNSATTRNNSPLHEEQATEQTNPLYGSNNAGTDNGNGATGSGRVQIWEYELGSLASSRGDDLAGILDGASLQVISENGQWHYNLQLDPDSDADGLGDGLQNSSFSISKRSARTGR